MESVKTPHWLGQGKLLPKIRYPRPQGLARRIKKLFSKETQSNGPQEKRS